ncbi:immunoglobulin lambda-1 light chain isoform X9 [Xenopus laevis]|uniref:immunoglobulin lambda-1 light chain isoform X9 n=1 Tax=Xenopus laevis TaxID=8355 RepID=UPI001BB2BFD1|nr:immunoglobulin lambda-1 light chain isoform X9 [Xenopus laevis]
MGPFLPIYLVLLWTAYAGSQTLSLSPSNNAVNLGERATFTCNVGAKDDNWVRLLKQIPGNVPQLIIYHHHSFNSTKYGPGIPTDRYTATINSAATEYQFIIKKAETADTAHYYCVKWFSSISAYVFSQSSKLIVTVDKFPEPALLVFPPYTEDNESKDSSTLTCHISKLAVSLVNVKWLIDGTTVQDGVSTSNPVRESDNTFSMSSYLTLASKDVNKDRMYSCIIQQEGSSAFISKGVKLSQC